MLSDIRIRNQHCGLIAASIWQVEEFMPDLLPVVETCPRVDYLFDIKVHMLMPGQWPCIPNWHCDFVPRDPDKTLRPDLIKEDAPPMYLLVSGEPLTEFRDGRKVEPWQWVKFTQRDEHRGVKATKFGWRVFVRAAHTMLFPEHIYDLPIVRRHTQVYIEPDFTW